MGVWFASSSEVHWRGWGALIQTSLQSKEQSAAPRSVSCHVLLSVRLTLCGFMQCSQKAACGGTNHVNQTWAVLRYVAHWQVFWGNIGPELKWLEGSFRSVISSRNHWEYSVFCFFLWRKKGIGLMCTFESCTHSWNVAPSVTHFVRVVFWAASFQLVKWMWKCLRLLLVLSLRLFWPPDVC